jgi:hypothetical protein
LVSISLLSAAGGVAPARMKIYIQPDGHGFESFIAAAFIRKHVPVVMTADKQAADYILTNAVISEHESTGGKIARCAFLYCIGIDGFQAATVQLLNAQMEVIWAYNVRKQNAENFQSSAESIAKHFKEYLEKPPKSPRESRKSHRKSPPA